MKFLFHNIQYGTGWLQKLAWAAFWAKSTRHFPTLQRFYRVADADVIGLVEVDAGSYRSGRKNQAEEIAAELGYASAFRNKYSCESLGSRLPVFKTQVNAVLSRLPIVATRFHELSRGQKRLVVEVDTPEVTVFVTHLSLGPKARRRQLYDLHDIVTARSKPCILAGDFNFLSGPWEAQLFLKASGLTSANAAGRGTFPSWAPLRELDFVCYSEELRLTRFRIPPVKLSDHLPLLCDFEIRGQK